MRVNVAIIVQNVTKKAGESAGVANILLAQLIKLDEKMFSRPVLIY